MRVPLSIFALPFLLFAPIEARAAHKEGRELIEECSATENDPVYFQKSASCISYLSGAIDSWMLDRAMRKIDECVPSVTGYRAKQLILIYVREHPEDLKFPAAMLVRLAFSTAYHACLQ